MKNRNIYRATLLLLVVGLLGAPTLAQAAAVITIVNVDGPGEGFNDPTPAAAVPPAIKGTNPGATLGEMRLLVFQAAADIWGASLDSNVEIFVTAAFNPLGAGILGSAGPTAANRDFGPIGNFPGAEFPATWYHIALANKRAGLDFIPGFAHINAQFSSNFVFYLGFDNNEGSLVDLLPVVLHELGHGLGFSNLVNEAAGTNFLGFTDAYSQYTLDATTGLHWSDMSDAQRQASAINVFNVVWDGPTVTAAVPSVLGFGVPQVVVNSPASIAGSYAAGTAAFGPPLTSPGITGTVVQALDPADGAGPSTTDGCSPLANGAAVAGNIAIVDRGTCGFIVKVKNAQNAGALAVIVADNQPGNPPAGLGGVDATIIIPSVRVTQVSGNTIKGQLPGVNATVGINPNAPAGFNAQGFTLVAALNPVVGGSSISHWDTSCGPNQLMEPAINSDLTSSVQPPQDLTLPQMRDIGWFPDGDLDGVANDGSDQCPESIQDATVIIDGCDSGVPNPVLASGCSITDLVMNCAVGAGDHGQFVSCVAHALNDLKKQGIITGAQEGKIRRCAAQADIP